MLLKGIRYRRRYTFGQPSGGREVTDHYMMDSKLAEDPRLRRISEAEQAFARQYIDALPAGATVADVPCGNGRIGQWVAGRDDLELIALDVNPAMLASLPLRWQGRRLPVRSVADVTHLPLADKCVDLFINMRLMHHIADRQTRTAMMREIARVTRGVVVSSFWNTHCWRYVRRWILHKPIRGYPISPRHYRAVCEESGLTVQKIVPVSRWHEEQCLVACRSTQT